jgi:hypothetical protein
MNPRRILKIARSLWQMVVAGFGILALLQQALFKPHPGCFMLTVLLNFGCRVMQLAAFVATIQALYIAFQYVSSGGEAFRYRELLLGMGFPLHWTPLVLTFITIFIFIVPAILKIWETRIIARMLRSLHERIAHVDVSLGVDLFATARLPAFFGYAIKLLSGCLFIVIALIVIAFFRVDLFLLILVASVFIVLSVILTSSKQINMKQATVKARTSYVEEARDFCKQQTGETSRRTVDETPVHNSALRRAYFSGVINTWSDTNRSGFNHGILSGLAIGAIVWFVFHLEDISSSQMMFLIFLVIAIRYAINTARETGSMMSKLLEARADIKNFKAVADLFNER